MEKQTTAQRLKQIMAERNLRQSDILEKAQPFCNMYHIKLGKSDLSQFENGKVVPGQWKLTILGLALNVSEAWLMGFDVPMQRGNNSDMDGLFKASNIIPLPPTHKVPLIGTIACGTPILAEENIEGYEECPNFVHADFALRCKGDSMINARIFDGDIVFIHIQSEVENGEIAAVQIDDDGEYDATLKRFYCLDKKITLRAENPTFSDIVLTGENMNRVHIAGKAVYFLSRVR